jgi:hypothetical protein
MTRELMRRALIIDQASGEFQGLPVNDPCIIGPANYTARRTSCAPAMPIRSQPARPILPISTRHVLLRKQV